MIHHPQSSSNVSLKWLTLMKEHPLLPSLSQHSRGAGFISAMWVYILLLNYCYCSEGFILVMNQVSFSSVCHKFTFSWSFLKQVTKILECSPGTMLLSCFLVHSSSITLFISKTSLWATLIPDSFLLSFLSVTSLYAWISSPLLCFLHNGPSLVYLAQPVEFHYTLAVLSLWLNYELEINLTQVSYITHSFGSHHRLTD